MKLLYDNRADDDKKFIFTVCDDILSAKYDSKPKSDNYAGIFVEGRDRECCIEDLAALGSFNLYSQYNYPIFCFLHNPDFFKDVSSFGVADSRVKIVPIQKIDSLEEYTKFCIEELYFMLPNSVEKLITLQPDGMLLKSGWEEFIDQSGVDWLSPHWRHMAGIEIKNPYTNNKWVEAFGERTAIGNGGFSFRKASLMRRLTKNYWDHASSPQRERGRSDDRIPMEDLFFCYWGYNTKMMRMPTLRQCDLFAQDPLSPEIYFGDNKPFGFHYFKDLSEPSWPPCTHN